MSVVLLISPRRSGAVVGEGSRAIPLATQEVFVRYWLQGSQALGLCWVPMFETGTPLKEDDIPDVVMEMERLIEWAKSSDVPASVLVRMSDFIVELWKVHKMPELDVFVG